MMLFHPPPFGFISERIRLNNKGEQMIQFKDIHDALEDGLRLLAIICIAFVLLMIFWFYECTSHGQTSNT